MTGLERARRRAVLTQQELADAADVSRGAIQKIEQGRNRTPHPRTLRKLASVLGCTPASVNPALEPAEEVAVG